MQLSIAALKEVKAFTGKPVKKVIKWKDNTFDCYVRPLSYQTAMGDIAAYHNGDGMAHRIASSICDADGVAMFTVNDVTGNRPLDEKGKPIGEHVGAFDGDLVNALIVAIGEVQNVGKTKG